MNYSYQYAGETFQVAIEKSGEKFRALYDQKTVEFEVVNFELGVLTLRFKEKIYTFHWAKEGSSLWIAHKGCTYYLEKPTWVRSFDKEERSGEQKLRAPMPSQVREILVEKGQLVMVGETLLLLEAMKMEIRIQSPIEAKVKEIQIKSGDNVEKDQILVELEV